jgi:hypothetical protein
VCDGGGGVKEKRREVKRSEGEKEKERAREREIRRHWTSSGWEMMREENAAYPFFLRVWIID